MNNKTKKLDTRITIWGEPNSPLSSQYGTIPYKEWCLKEVERMRANGGQAVIVELDGMVAVDRP